MEGRGESKGGVGAMLRVVCDALPDEADLALVGELLGRGDFELAAEELKQLAAEHGQHDEVVWTALAGAFRSMGFDEDADECRLIGRILRGELTSPWVRLSDRARVLLEKHEGETLGDVTILDDLGATFVQATWEVQGPMDACVVFAETEDGDVWVLDTADGESVHLLSHEALRDGVRHLAERMPIADDLADALRLARE